MRDVYIDFSPQIIQHGIETGQHFTGDDLVALDQTLNLLLEVDPLALRLGFVMGMGRYGNLQQALSMLRPQPERMAA